MIKSLLFIGLFTVLALLVLVRVMGQKEQVQPQVQVSPTTSPRAKEQPRSEIQSSPQSPLRGMLSVRDLSTLRVAELSDRIVLAKCRAVDVRELAGGNIFTFSEFEVLENVKGNSDENSFTLRLLGGRVGNVEITSPISRDFNPGEKYVLFLGATNADGYPTIAPQAIFEVRINPVDKNESIVPNPTGLRLHRAKDKQRYSAPPEHLPLEDFLFSLSKVN